MARTGRHHYTAADLKFALPWEQEILTVLENKLMSDIRKTFFHLAQSRRSLNLAQKVNPNHHIKLKDVIERLEKGDPNLSWLNEYQ